VNAWLKKAVLLYFRTHDNEVIDAGYTRFFDKVPLKYAARSQADDGESLRTSGARVVPPAVARRGSYIAANTVLMPSYVNIGAYVDSGTMVDTWATVGSCAQIGKNVHLSGGVGIGGVLEPLQAAPTIIEDNCSSAHGRKWSKASSSRKGRSSRWACSSARAPRSMTAPRGRCCRVACQRGRWWCRAICLVRRQVLVVLRRNREARRCADAREDVDQRTAARR
jgi:hypothetical protein